MRLNQYLAYHNASARIGDIDPSYVMLRYLCDRYELNTEQRYWIAFLYAMTYAGASAFYVYNEFPDYENVDVGRLERWWLDRGREQIICQTDRRWVRSMDMFVPAVVSYNDWLAGRTQEEHFAQFNQKTPEERYDALYSSARCLYSFGQFALFLYLEALHTITPIDLMPTDLDLNKAWSCRNGLYYAFGMDEHIVDEESRTDPAIAELTQDRWKQLRQILSELPIPPTIWQTETILCAFRKWFRMKRYVGYYLDRQANEIAKMEINVPDGVCWRVLWEYRSETYDHAVLAEKNDGLKNSGKITGDWQLHGFENTRKICENF